MQTIRISQQLESVLSIVVNVLCLVVLVAGLASMMSARPAAPTGLREVRLDTVVITGHREHKLARSEAPASVLSPIQ